MKKSKTPIFESDATLQMAAVAIRGKNYTVDEADREKARQNALEIYKKYFKD